MKNREYLFFILILIFISCSKKIVLTNSLSYSENQVSKTVVVNEKYIPPRVISISDDVAKSSKEGELYYDNEFGYRYWRNSDGKYYLDSKYEIGISPNQKNITKRQKKLKKQPSSVVKEEELVIQ